jgi:hypothetical protein
MRIWYYLRWICVYDVVILILYMHSYFLYVEFTSYPTCGKWSPTPLWCGVAGWGSIIVVRFLRMAWSLLVFYRFDFGVLFSGALIRIVGILFMLSDFVWGTLGSFIWCTYFEIWCMTFMLLRLISDMIWYFMTEIWYVLKVEEYHLNMFFSIVNYYFKISMWGLGCYKSIS